MSSLAGAGGRVVTGGAALVVDQSGTTSFAGAISGSGGFTKRGSGALALTGSHTFTGVTLVEGGRLAVDGFITGDAVVGGGATLSGTGSVGGAVIVQAGGTLAPGNFTVGPLTIIGTMMMSGSAVTSVNAASLAVADTGTGGRIDLGVGRINVAPGGIAPEALVIDILAGRDGNPAGAWTGSTGITSSVAALAAATGGSLRAVGWIDNGVGGLAVAFSAPGDTNIDGLIDILDVAEFLGTGQFDAGSYLPGAASSSAPSITAVPEPSMCAFVVAGLACGGWCFARRRSQT
jgi:autotransporter-associated beta strand protein